VTHSLLGVVCGLLRARVTTETNSEVLKSACVRVLPHWTDIFVENRDTLRVRSSVWFTTRMLATGKNSEVLKSACARVLPHWTNIFVENRDTLRVRSSVWFTTRTSNCREQNLWFSKARLWEFNSLNWHLYRIVTHSVSGVLYDLLCARVTAENKLSGCQSALLRV